MLPRRQLLLGAPLLAAAPRAKPKEPEVSPVEDLMREHGLLNRVLLVYEECARRLEAKQPAPAVAGAARIIQEFIEAYHEKLEEEFVFPRFVKASRQVELVGTLVKQHAAGREITARILGGAGDTAALLRSFVRMYRPHEAREDTVLFPELRALVGEREWDRLGDRFEDREHQLFGAAGFEGKVAEVARLEEQLGIGDLAQFTP